MKHILNSGSLSYLCCLLLGFYQLSEVRAENKPRLKPNIILFLVDDLGWMDVSYNGSSFYETPNIDQMVKDGMTFTNAYANAPNCAPSRACIMTGLYTPRHGIYTVASSERGKASERKLIPVANQTILPSSYKTLAEAMKEQGYLTWHLGKWHLGDDEHTSPEGQGFDINIAGNHSGSPKGGYFSPYNNPQLKDGPDGEYLTDRLTNEAIKLIEANKDSSFFMYFSHYAVHTPIQAKQPIVDKYEQKKTTKEHDNARYAAMVQSMDESLGRLFEQLRASEIENNTLVILFSDNGGHGVVTSCYPLKGFKGTMYEGGVRVPMVAKWQNHIPAGITCDEPVMGTDLYPTFLELAGIKAKKPDGESLKDLMLNNKPLKREALFWHFPAYLEGGKKYKHPEDFVNGFRAVPYGAIRKGDWKLIENFEDGSYQLYNLKEDISESTNLETEFPQIVLELKKEMEQWRMDVNAPVPDRLNPAYQISN